MQENLVGVTGDSPESGHQPLFAALEELYLVEFRWRTYPSTARTDIRLKPFTGSADDLIDPVITDLRRCGLLRDDDQISLDQFDYLFRVPPIEVRRQWREAVARQPGCN
jgi:hypothetical protein